MSVNTRPEEVILYYFPEADDEDIDYVLWNHTRWPYGPIVSIADEVYKYYLNNRR